MTITSTSLTEFDLILAALRAETTKGQVIDDRTGLAVTLTNVGRFYYTDRCVCVNITYGKLFALHRIYVDSFGVLRLEEFAIKNSALVTVSEVPSDIESVVFINGAGINETNTGNYSNYQNPIVGYIDLVEAI